MLPKVPTRHDSKEDKHHPRAQPSSALVHLPPPRPHTTAGLAELKKNFQLFNLHHHTNPAKALQAVSQIEKLLAPLRDLDAISFHQVKIILLWCVLKGDQVDVAQSLLARIVNLSTRDNKIALGHDIALYLLKDASRATLSADRQKTLIGFFDAITLEVRAPQPALSHLAFQMSLVIEDAVLQEQLIQIALRLSDPEHHFFKGLAYLHLLMLYVGQDKVRETERCVDQWLTLPVNTPLPDHKDNTYLLTLAPRIANDMKAPHVAEKLTTYFIQSKHITANNWLTIQFLNLMFFQAQQNKISEARSSAIKALQSSKDLAPDEKVFSVMRDTIPAFDKAVKNPAITCRLLERAIHLLPDAEDYESLTMLYVNLFLMQMQLQNIKHAFITFYEIVLVSLKLDAPNEEISQRLSRLSKMLNDHQLESDAKIIDYCATITNPVACPNSVASLKEHLQFTRFLLKGKNNALAADALKIVHDKELPLKADFKLPDDALADEAEVQAKMFHLLDNAAAARQLISLALNLIDPSQRAKVMLLQAYLLVCQEDDQQAEVIRLATSIVALAQGLQPPNDHIAIQLEKLVFFLDEFQPDDVIGKPCEQLMQEAVRLGDPARIEDRLFRQIEVGIFQAKQKKPAELYQTIEAIATSAAEIKQSNELSEKIYDLAVITAIAFFQEKYDIKKMESLLHCAIRLQFDSEKLSWLYLELAASALRQKNPQEAIQYAKDAIDAFRKHPHQQQILFNVACQLYSEGCYGMAIKLFLTDYLYSNQQKDLIQKCLLGTHWHFILAVLDHYPGDPNLIKSDLLKQAIDENNSVVVKHLTALGITIPSIPDSLEFKLATKWRESLNDNLDRAIAFSRTPFSSFSPVCAVSDLKYPATAPAVLPKAINALIIYNVLLTNDPELFSIPLPILITAFSRRLQETPPEDLRTRDCAKLAIGAYRLSYVPRKTFDMKMTRDLYNQVEGVLNREMRKRHLDSLTRLDRTLLRYYFRRSGEMREDPTDIHFESAVSACLNQAIYIESTMHRVVEQFSVSYTSVHHRLLLDKDKENLKDLLSVMAAEHSPETEWDEQIEADLVVGLLAAMQRFKVPAGDSKALSSPKISGTNLTLFLKEADKVCTFKLSTDVIQGILERIVPNIMMIRRSF